MGRTNASAELMVWPNDTDPLIPAGHACADLGHQLEPPLSPGSPPEFGLACHDLGRPGRHPPNTSITFHLVTSTLEVWRFLVVSFGSRLLVVLLSQFLTDDFDDAFSVSVCAVEFWSFHHNPDQWLSP